MGFERNLFTPNLRLISPLVYHLILISTLFTFALIESERLRVPSSIFGFALIAGIVVPFILLNAIQVGWLTSPGSALSHFGFDKWLTILLGGLAGTILGFFLSHLLPPFQDKIVSADSESPEAEDNTHVSTLPAPSDTGLATNAADFDDAQDAVPISSDETIVDVTMDLSISEYDFLDEPDSANETETETNGSDESTESSLYSGRSPAKLETLQRIHSASYLLPGLVLVGLYLGWQAAATVTLLLLAGLGLIRGLTKWHPNYNGLLLVVTLIQLLVWRWLIW